jgi:hypothetical protein
MRTRAPLQPESRERSPRRHSPHGAPAAETGVDCPSTRVRHILQTELNRYESIQLAPFRQTAGVLSVLLASLLSAGCGPDTATRLAGRVLEDHRTKASVRPRPEAGSIRVRLSPALPEGGEGGSAQIEWAGPRYRETVTSAGVSTVRGIQAGKAFFVDEDGITRVGSEPMLAELLTRSYFWRRAYLFEDRERAKLSLGPTDDATVSVRLRPRGGNELRLVFDRRSGALEGVVSPRFRLQFESPTKFRDLSRRVVDGAITWTGLPTRRLPDPEVGGWHGRFSEPSAQAELSRTNGGVSIPARISGVAARLAIDADADGPLRISPELGRKAGLAGQRDVFGRLLARGAALEIGSLSMPSLCVEIAETGAAGIDAVAGGTLYRETVVEIDPSSRRFRLHDPARWVAPEGFGRNLLDDDGDLPVAILFRSGRRLRLRAGVRASSPLVLPAALASGLGIDPNAPALAGLVWGTLRLPPLPVRLETAGFDPEWGDDGAIGFPLLLRFHVFADMPHRWVFVKAASSAGDSR